MTDSLTKRVQDEASDAMRQRIPNNIPSVFARFVDQMPEFMFAMQPTGEISYVNATARRYIGRNSVGMNVVDVFDGDVRSQVASLLPAIADLAFGETVTEDLELSVDACFRLTFQTWPGNDGEIAMISAIGRDRSAEIRAQREIELANQRLAASNRDLQDFAYVASHDLQEPLRKIMAFSDRLASRHADQLDEQAQDYLGRVQHAATRMQRLIEDLLTFSRVSTNGDERMPTDLGSVVAEVLIDLEVAVEESAATIRWSGLPTLVVEPSQMRQLFQNLLGNALKFRKPDVAPVVSISAEQTGGTWQIMLSDNGIGFEQGYADKIFTVFQRLHGRHAYEGSGVGLAVCRKIAERHQGDIRATSSVGCGATFTISLPAVSPIPASGIRSSSG